jgi:hypothetical protein
MESKKLTTMELFIGKDCVQNVIKFYITNVKFQPEHVIDRKEYVEAVEVGRRDKRKKPTKPYEIIQKNIRSGLKIFGKLIRRGIKD